MSDQTPTPTQIADWHDPIVQELHEIRAQLVAKYNGDMSAYSQAAKTHALALGFQLAPMAGLMGRVDTAVQDKRTVDLV